MSGHSKWATIRRGKEANDAKRGKIFTKIGREIEIAVREGGSDPESNFRLRLILDSARRANMPKDNLERAIKRGAGELQDGIELSEAVYEGYGPHGTAIMVEALSDNRNRTVSEIRHIFSRYAGNLGSEGCVAWMFSHKGYIVANTEDNDPEELALAAIDAGAEDVEIGDGTIEIYTQLADFSPVQRALEEASVGIDTAQLSWIPQTTRSLGEHETLKTMKLLEALEETDDVQQVYSNLEIQDEMIAKYEAAAA